MKKILFLIALFTLFVGANSYATKLYATYGTPAGNGSFNQATGEYSWDSGSNNLMDLFVFGSGELAEYESLHFSTSDYVTGPYRVCFMNGGTVVATIAFYSAGDKNLVFSQREELKDKDLSTITSIKFGGLSGSGSVTITKKPYIEKPFSLVIGDDGKAVIDITDLSASGCLSVDYETGELTSTLGEDGAPAWGRLAINFPNEGVNLSNLTGFSVNYSVSVLFNNFEIGNKGFWSSVMGRDDLANYTSDFGDPTKVTVWRWNVSQAGTQTITSVTLKFSSIIALDPHETPLTTGMYVGSPESHFGEVLGQGATIYGMGNGIDGTQYVDLSDYDEMHIYGTPGKSIRLLFNYDKAEPVKTDVVNNLDGKGYYSLDLSTLSAQKLNCIKFPWDGASGVINKVILYKKSVPVAYSYVLSGKGEITPSAAAALADGKATSYDATGVTGTGVDFTGAANPNALFIANSGVLANTNNVIVSDVCASLELTDGDYSFKAPAGFTATNVSYNRTFAENQASTVCLPFALTQDECDAAGKFYELTAYDGATLTFTQITSGGTTAYKPYLFRAKADGQPFNSYASVNKPISASDAISVTVGSGETATMTGTLAHQSVNGKYGWNSADGTFSKATSDAVTIDPFRAYISIPGESLARVATLFVDSSVTGINEVSNSEDVKSVKNFEGKVFENGKIYIFKKGMKFNAAGAQVK